MKIEARFTQKKPEVINNIDRMKIMHGKLELEISHSSEGLRISLNQPFGDQLLVFPQASNGITLRAGRE